MEEFDELRLTIDRLLSTGAGVDDFIPLVRRLLIICPSSVGSVYPAGAELYRTTKHHRSVPTLVTELSHPPPGMASLGRANRAGQPVFYCSPDPGCTFHEVGISLGQLVVHAKWTTRKKMILHDLGYTNTSLASLSQSRTLPDRHRSHYEMLSEVQQAIRDYLAMAFVDRTSRAYSLTAAIAEVSSQPDEISGLLYPAIATVGRVDNIALTPEFARDGLELTSAQLVLVDHVEAQGEIGGEVVCDLSKVEANGTLRWSFRAKGEPIEPGGAMPIAPGSIYKSQSSGQLQIDGRMYQVEPGYSIEVSSGGVVTVRDILGGVVEPK